MHSPSNSNRIRIYRFYPDCLFFLLDAWLKKMSKNGYHLVDYGIITYVFEKGNPEDREYFTYSCDRIGEGIFSILLRYPNLANTYGKKKKRSKLNKSNHSKGRTILEIDTDSISLKNNIGYNELIKDRNRLYFVRAVRDIAFFLFMILILIVLYFI